MEQIKVVFDDHSKFDTIVHGTDGMTVLPDGGDLSIVTKDGQTESGRSIAVLTFTVSIDGKLCRAQTVVPVRLLTVALRALQGRYGEDGRVAI